MTFAKEMKTIPESWLEAARDLSIRVLEPNPLADVADDLSRAVYIPDFGGRRGAIAFTQNFSDSESEDFKITPLKDAGYYWSILSDREYKAYNRELFVETLVDWGYFGTAETCPSWYHEELSRIKQQGEQGGGADAEPAV